MEQIYLDNAATTKLDEGTLNAMMPYFTDIYGNSNSQHSVGREAMKGVDNARLQIANAIGAQASEIYFTASGTEADNWALKGAAFAKRKEGKHIITSAIEHHAIINSCEWLTKEGFEITYLPVDEFGVVSVDELKKALRADTILVSIMTANNEVGTIQPIKEIATYVHQNSKAIVHTDAVQAMGSLKINIKELGVDLLTMSAHKFYGPKGIGALYIKNGVHIDKLVVGGSQERSMRGGTSNTPSIIGFGYAIEKAVKDLDKNANHSLELRERLISKVIDEIPFVKLNGHRTQRLPNNVNFSFQYIEGESLLMLLDLVGICVSSGSACSSGSLEPSHVLKALGVQIALAHGSIRFSFGKYNSIEDVDYVVEQLKLIVDKLRVMSPLFKLNKGEIKNA